MNLFSHTNWTENWGLASIGLCHAAPMANFSRHMEFLDDRGGIVACWSVSLGWSVRPPVDSQGTWSRQWGAPEAMLSIATVLVQRKCHFGALELSGSRV